MAFIVIGVVAFFVSGLALFAGFGLGTLLLPTFALFFPIEIAVASTAVVHGLNGLFKVSLLGRHAAPRVVIRFGVPAILAAFVGAAVLTTLSTGDAEWGRWEFAGRTAVIRPIGFLMGLLIIAFALIELTPRLREVRVPVRWLPLGGMLSGFFGGLSGHQGALRAAFLVPLELTPSVYAGTQSVLAVMVDASRILVYGVALRFGAMAGVSGGVQWGLIAVGTLCAFAGVLVGKRLLHTVTIELVRSITGVLLLVVGLGLASGWLG